MELKARGLEGKVLHATKDVLKELSESEPSESGYIVLYNPENTQDYYTIGRVKIGQRKGTNPLSIDAKMIEYLVQNPDASIAHYMRISNSNERADSDRAENLGLAIELYSDSQGSFDLLAEIKNHEPEFMQLFNCYGYHAFPMPFKRADNSELLRYENRIRELLLDLPKISSSDGPGEV